MFPEILCISADGAEVLVAAVWDLTAEGMELYLMMVCSLTLGSQRESRAASMLPHEASRGGGEGKLSFS